MAEDVVVDDLTDLARELANKVATLRMMARRAPSAVEAQRLGYMADGVKLSLSFVQGRLRLRGLDG